MSHTTLDSPKTAAGPRDDMFWYAQGDPWTLEQAGWQPDRSLYFETIFSLANGYMGFRGYREEVDNLFASCREGYLAGMFARMPPVARKLVIHDFPWDSRQMISLPQIFGALIILDGELFNVADGELLSYRQTLDMRTAVLERRIEWRTRKGNTTWLRFTRFLSAETPNLAVHRIEVEPVNWSGPVEIWWDYDISEKTVFRCGDPARAHVACSSCNVLETDANNGVVRGLAETIGTRHRIAFSSKITGGIVASSAEAAGLLSQTATATVKQGRAQAWVRCTVIATNRDTGVTDPCRTAGDLLEAAVAKGHERLVAEHAARWRERWLSADIELDGPARDQALVRFGIFSLLQVAPFHADNLSIPARCYAYNRYNGLYFWDGEIFLLPFYQFCAPAVARNLLAFRCGTLPGAKRNARALGAPGAIFPWQGDADFGEEQAPWGLQAYLWHQNADIIYAFDQYARATGDEDFLCGEALEVLAETARFWAAKFELGKDGRYHLDGTVGPDEAEEHGPDNGYTSLMARRSLQISHRWWLGALERNPAGARMLADRLELGADEIAQWLAIAEHVNIPEVPGCPGVPLQDAFLLKRRRVDLAGMSVADFWKCRGEVQVIKQADIVLAMCLLEDSFTRGQIRDGYAFYEPLTLHVSSLSYNTHSIVAALIGHREAAYAYFHRAAGLDLDNLRDATKDGLHAAAQGGVWQMTLSGFMGMRVREDHLQFEPCLPDAWRAIRFALQYRGWRLAISAGGGVFRAEVAGEGQPGARLRVGSGEHLLAAGEVIETTY